MYVIIWALGFIALILVFEGFSSALSSRSNHNAAVARRRLREITRKLQDPKADDAGESMLRSVKPEKSSLESLADALPGQQDIQLRLYRAGLSIPAVRFVYLSIALAAVGFSLGLLFLGDPLKSLMGLALGVLALFQISRMHANRLIQFDKQFPDALDLLIRALRAGHSLTAGFVMVGDELSDPIGSEFAHVADAVPMGQTMRKALTNLAYRVDSLDLPFFVTAIAIQQETGSNLAEVLENLANVMRERFKLHGKVRALTAMGRASANLLAAWPLVTLASLYMVNPGCGAPFGEAP